MVKFSLFLILVAFLLLGATLAPVLAPNNPTILDALERILCNSDENLIQQVSPTARSSNNPSEFLTNMNLSCKPVSGATYSVDDKLFGIGLTGFLVVLVFGVLFFIIGLIRNASRRNQPTPASTYGVPPYYPPQPAQRPASYGSPVATFPTATQMNTRPLSSQPAPSEKFDFESAATMSIPKPTAAPPSAPPAPSSTFDFDSAATMMSIPKPTSEQTPPPAPAAHAPADSKALKTRLKQLQEAHEAGLISDQEFERSKSDLLRDFTDVD